ncbi:MAG: hypothetical protein PUP93_33095 [Rhizonema sp. NSF051]|nr:hypothetical protein [Rhizonema sp. NSF051]
MKAHSEACLGSDDSFKDKLLPSSNDNLQQQASANSETNVVEYDIKKGRAFQAYLASKKERSEVYRRLAES